MTVCIAANCANGTAVVVASDRMLSAPFLTVEFDHSDAKIDVVSETCVALSAGDALAADAILAGGPGFAGQLSSPLIEHFGDHFRDRYVQIRRRAATEQLLESRGTNFEEFYQRGGIQRFPPDLAMLLDDRIQRLGLGVSIILAGVDQSGAHIYSIEDPGSLTRWDRLGYHAIGSGQHHAMMHMLRKSQDKNIGLNETVFNVYCSKRTSEVAPGVGMATEMRVITRNGIRSLTPAELQALASIYDKWSQPKTDDVNALVKELPYDQVRAYDRQGTAQAG